MLWKCKECQDDSVQTKDNKPPLPWRRHKNNDHVCKEWEEDKTKPGSYADLGKVLEEGIKVVGKVRYASDEEEKNIDEELKKKRIKKLKKGTFYREIQKY